MAQKSWMCAQSLSHVRLSATLWTIAHQAPLSMEFSRQEYWHGLPLPPPGSFQSMDWTQVHYIIFRDNYKRDLQYLNQINISYLYYVEVNISEKLKNYCCYSSKVRKQVFSPLCTLLWDDPTHCKIYILTSISKSVSNLELSSSFTLHTYTQLYIISSWVSSKHLKLDSSETLISFVVFYSSE